MSLVRKATVRLFMVVLVVEVFLFSCETLLPNLRAEAVTKTYVIDASRDDAWSKVDDVKWDDDSYYLSRSDMRAGCRWRIDIPKGATIEEAYFICKAKDSSQAGAKCRIQVFDQDSCEDFDAIFWDWPVMSEAVDWNLPSFTQDVWYNSPDLKTIIQAYIDRPAYVSENYVGLKFVWQGGTEREHEVWALDGSASSAAKLEVTYATRIPPTADFTYSPEAPNVGEAINFDASSSNDSDGTIVSYSWDFGDDTPEVTEIDPFTIHTYTSWGTFTATLNVTDNEGLWDTESKQITVRGPPYADFTWSPTTPEEGKTVNFDGSASTPDGGTLVSWEWNFGDTTPSITEGDPFTNHVYTSYGTYTVTLNVTDSEGKWGTASKPINVVAKPHAHFTWIPLSPQMHETVTFDASSSTSNGGTIVSYRWNMGDGTVLTEDDPIALHQYMNYGTFTVALNVTDSEGKWDIESKQITVRAHPIARFTWTPTTPKEGETVTFDASASTSDGGVLVSWEWDFGDDTPKVKENDPFTTHVYSSPGLFTVTLNVTDDESKWDLEVKQIGVAAVVPPKAAFAWTPASPREGETITFNASLSTPDGGNIVSYSWDFDDDGIIDSYGMIVNHEYDTHGNYIVSLKVTDSDGLWDTESKSITVVKPPVASFTYSPTMPLVDETVIFNASSSMTDGGTIVSYLWDFDDSTPVVNETSPITDHEYTTAGTYNVTLTVIDSERLSDSTSRLVKVRIPGAPVADFTYSPTAPTVGETTIFNASSSYDSDGFIANYTWDFGVNTNGLGVIVTHAYTTAGSYNITLTVTDDEGLSDTATRILIVYVHDVAIVSVAPSATEVYAGQIINITLTVRNEGNVTEIFNVTLYYDGHAIGTQTVTDLEPKTETTLKFSWDTTDVTPDVICTLKAVASEVAGETETVDNTYTYDNVRVKSQVTSPPFDWSTILPYLIPVLSGVLGLVVVGIVRKKREVGRGFEFFNEMIDGGIPDAYSVMIIGGAGSGKSVLCQQLTYNYLTEGKSCIYVTYDIFPFEVRQNMKNFRWDISPYEHEGAFVLVDCYSSIAGLGSEEKYHLEQPFALSDLGIAISTAMGEVKQKSTRVFLDSTTPLFTSLDPPKVMNFLRDRSAKIKGDNGIFLFTVGKDTVPSGLMHRLEGIVDCIIELDIHEEKGETLRKIRIKKLRGRRFADMWVPFKIELKKGITFLPPKGWSKGRRR